MTNYEKMKSMSVDELAKFIEQYFAEAYLLIKSWLEYKGKKHQMTNYELIKTMDVNDVTGLFEENLPVDCIECPYDGKGCIYGNPNASYQNGERPDCWHAIKNWLESESEED